MIDGVKVKEMKPIADERGMVMEILRSDDAIFKKFGLYDSREKSPTKGKIDEFFIGVRRNILVQIPPGVYHGFKCVGENEAIMINIPTEVYNHSKPDEYRLPWNDPSIPYNWDRQNG